MERSKLGFIIGLTAIVGAGIAVELWRRNAAEFTRPIIFDSSGTPGFEIKRTIQPSENIEAAIRGNITASRDTCPRSWALVDLDVMQEQPEIIYKARIRCL